jgi:hypothetical protein
MLKEFNFNCGLHNAASGAEEATRARPRQEGGWKGGCEGRGPEMCARACTHIHRPPRMRAAPECLTRSSARPRASLDVSPHAASGVVKPYDGTTVRGVNILKVGDDPAILPDEQYPTWLWGLTIEGAGYLEMRKRFIDDPSKLSKDELSTYFMQRRRVEIKEKNAELAK